jgi:rubrerythrin
MNPTAVSTGVMMPGGWHFKAYGKMIVNEAESYTDLIHKLAQYRAANGMELGDPQEDIDRYICTTFPNMCGAYTRVAPEEGVDPVETSYGVPVKKTPRERVMQWAVNRMQKVGQIEFVDKEEADRRALICSECPHRIRWNEPIEGCPGCQTYVEQAESMLVKLRANKETGYWNAGYSCNVAGHDIETACWLEEPALRHRRNYEGEFPDACWLKDL